MTIYHTVKFTLILPKKKLPNAQFVTFIPMYQIIKFRLVYLN